MEMWVTVIFDGAIVAENVSQGLYRRRAWVHWKRTDLPSSIKGDRDIDLFETSWCSCSRRCKTQGNEAQEEGEIFGLRDGSYRGVGIRHWNNGGVRSGSPGVKSVGDGA